MINRIISRLIQEHRYFRLGSEEDSNTEELSDVIFQSEMESLTSPKEYITKKQFIDTIAKVRIKPNNIQKLVLNYLIKNEMMEEAIIFASESGIDLSKVNEFKMKKICQEIASLFIADEIDSTIESIDQVNKEILQKNPLLKFKIKCFKLNKLKKVDFESVNKFVIRELTSIAAESTDCQAKSEIISNLENTIGQFYMTNEFMMKKSDVLAEIVKEILNYCDIKKTSKIDELIYLLTKVQKSVKKNAEIPVSTDDGFFSLSKLFLD